MKTLIWKPKLVFFGCAVWNWYHRCSPLCTELLRLGAEVIYIEPLVYKDANSEHLLPRSRVPVPTGLKIVKRTTRLRRGFLMFLWENILNLREYIRLRPDAVILYSVTSCFLLQTLRPLLPRSLFVLDYIDDWPEWSKVPKERILLREFFVPFAARHADTVTVTAQLLEEDLKPYSEQIVYIPNGSPGRPEAFKETPIPPRPRVVFVGGLAERIDLDSMIQAAKGISEADFDVVGGGPRLEQFRREARDIPNLHVHGPKPYEEAMKYVDRAAVGLIPYKISRLTDRCFPVKLADYWSRGKTAVVAPTYELRQVADGAVLFAEGAGQMEEQVRRLISDGDLRNRLAREGWRRASELYNYEVLARRFLDICIH